MLSITQWAAVFAAILIAEFPTCLGVYEHIKNRASLSSSFPYFDASAERNVTSFLGQVTHLHCTVRDLGDRTVSWIRKADLHVLTSDVLTFTGDQRFSAHHSTESGVWTLQIRYTQLRDEGEYQCQVNTEPKISFSIFLTVLEAKARIDSPSNKEVHVKQRSQVKLTCVVDLGSSSGSQSAAVFWYLDGQALDWLGQTGRGRGVQVTEKRGNQLISTLTIERADMHHAGKFTCAPSYAKPDTVTVHVIDGESRAELQGNSSVRHRLPFNGLIFFLLIYIFGLTHVDMSAYWRLNDVQQFHGKKKTKQEKMFEEYSSVESIQRLQEESTQLKVS